MKKLRCQPLVKGNRDKVLFQTKISRNQDVVNAANDGYLVTYRKSACKASKAYVKFLDEMVRGWSFFMDLRRCSSR